MNVPVSPETWLLLATVDSTQAHASKLLAEGDEETLVILAREQTAGKGRFGRSWHSPESDSLSMSLILRELKGHPRPWLIGMALACAAAGALHCRLRWPNDLFLDGRKLGGILTEIIEGIPVVGIGVNLNQTSFPKEIAATATSLATQQPAHYEPTEIAARILEAFNQTPQPDDWPDLAAIWDIFDDTPGKEYKLATGELGRAIGLGPHGELLCTINGKVKAVLAADAVMEGTGLG